MPRYRTALASGHRPPYDTWVFAVVPEVVRQALGGDTRIDVRGTVAGVPFQSTIQKGDGAYRFVVTRAVQAAAGVAVGDMVEVTVDVDVATRDVAVPRELQQVLVAERLQQTYERLPPAHRRAWAQHVASAKQPATRARRAQRAVVGIRARLFPGQRLPHSDARRDPRPPAARRGS